MPVSQPSPALLAPLEHLLAPLESLKGTGPRQASLLANIAGGKKVIDLLFTLPERFINRETIRTVCEGQTLPQGEILTCRVRVVSVRRPRRTSQPTILVTEDETGPLDLVFFQKGRLFLPPAGTELLVSGKTGSFQDRLTLSRPDYVIPWEKRQDFPWLEPVWPLTAGLFPSTVRRAMNAALALVPNFPEWQNPDLVRKNQWPDFRQALFWLHDPGSLPTQDGKQTSDTLLARARARLAADEILADQLCLRLARYKAQQRPGRALKGNGHLQDSLLSRFGHAPTKAQSRAIGEIIADMQASSPMMRLLQGDVGAGKTLVAMLAMLHAVEAGTQAALMAPTEILARQHFETLSRLCPAKCVFLSGSIKGKARRETLAQIASGAADIIIGTHALFQEAVQFSDLGLAVIDEQHRFGVEQRMKLGAKGETTDILIMTATPIPRTVQLTEWGEMGVSRLDSKPKGRQPVRTTLHDMAMMDDLLVAIRRALNKGQQIFWVCPLIENSETQSASAAENRWAELTKSFGSVVGLAHGRQDIAIRQESLDHFREGKTRILVATTVIEVGVDIPNATIMVIEEAERFGLAQLHQLRGRIGRGTEKSYCLLLHSSDASMIARQRLGFLRDTEDGFAIADEDFRLRGGGDLAGSRQSGLPGFRLAHDTSLPGLITAMSPDSRHIVTNDPQLLSERGNSLRLLLYLFDRASPERLLVSG